MLDSKDIGAVKAPAIEISNSGSQINASAQDLAK
jgi:hypothetical protein